jgi:hypothetical protein
MQGTKGDRLMAAQQDEKEVKKPFDVGDAVTVAKTDLLPTGFEGTVGKVYENSILIEIDPNSVSNPRSEELHDLHGRVVVRMSEAKKK